MKYQKRSVYISIIVLAFFLVLSLVTRHWGFFLWSLLPVFMVLMTTFSTKIKKNNEKKGRFLNGAVLLDGVKHFFLWN